MPKSLILPILSAFAIMLSSCASEEVQAEGNQVAPSSSPAAEAKQEAQATPIPFDQAKIKEMHREIEQLNQAYDKAFSSKNLQLFKQTDTQGDAFVKRLEAIEMISHPAHPAYHCKTAAVYMTTNRAIAWVTLNSDSPTDADKRIDAANAAETAEEIKACAVAAQASAK